MRIWLGFLAALAVISSAGTLHAADFKTLRRLTAPPPSKPPPLAEGAKARPVQFARLVIQPKDGGAWALAYESLPVRAEGDRSPTSTFLTWVGVRDTVEPMFASAFDDELAKAGFKGQSGQSLFDDNSGSADLKVGVLIDDLKGRYCVDCPNLLNPNGIPATVLMAAHWEVYSTLDRKVIARITTEGGAEYRTRLTGNITPPVVEAFRENVRQLLASEDFRRVVTTPTGAPLATTAQAVPTPIALLGPKIHGTVAQASKSVAIVYAADGLGSGFLVSSDGYVITNQHVVGGSKYVKLKWSNGAETVGEVLRADARRDVALIKTDAQGRPPLALRLGAVQQGETVFAIGTPLDDKLQNTMTKGIVSAERIDQGLRLIQSDVTINHGNSGGPLIDEKGQVIALTVSGIAPNGSPVGLNFFIPIEDALKALALTPSA